jgi:hypothetical protein
MDRFHPMLPGNTTDAPSEALPLLYTTSGRHPYQSYCETVTDSSSPPRSSGLSLSNSILRSRTPSLDFAFDSQQREPNEAYQNILPVLSAASSPGRYVDDVPLLKTGSGSKRQTSSPNRKQRSSDTTTGSPNHITPAVTPRGSHLLARYKVTAYDRTPSHPRMQQMKPSNGATVRTIPWKPIEREKNYAVTKYHPLPLLPLRTFAVHDGYARLSDTGHEVAIRAQEKTSTGERLEYPREDEPPPLPKHSDRYVKRRPLPAPPIDYSPPSPSKYPGLTPSPRNDYIRDSSRSHRRNILNHQAQLPLSAELYEPCGLLPEPEDDRQARRRTQPKETTLRYQFGDRPPRVADVPLSKPSRLDLFREQTDAFLYASPDQGSTLTPSIYSLAYIQTGPRPPPWRSYEDLEMQRLQRGDQREGEHVPRHRVAMDSRSTLQQDHSTESFGLKPSIVVEQFERQIEREFPDGLGGQAARSESDWCCCVIM